MLKRKKGFNIVTKSAKCKLLREGFDLVETKQAFNDVVTFYFLVISNHPEGVAIPVKENGGWRYYELLTIGDEAQYPLPFDGFPCALRRSAIRKAVGAWQSWNSSYQRWQNRPKKHKQHRPPVPPRQFNFSPSFDAGMWKEDDGRSICLKLLIKGQWKWIKFCYQAPDIAQNWVKGSPLVVVKGNAASIVFPLEKYVPATGGIKKLMAQESFRILAVDTDLDTHIAICSVLEINAKCEVVEIARHFINQTQHTKRRKRDLGIIASKMQQTGIVEEGFTASRWKKLHNREVEAGRAYARQIAEMAHDWQCCVISFEHLANLKPVRGRYSRRSNQKRAYWLKSRVFKETNQVAYQDYGILTTRVSPKNTSRFDPFGNRVWRDNEIHKLLPAPYKPGATFVGSHLGYVAHSGINAARNIGLKAILRHRTNAIFVWRKASSSNGRGVQ